MLFSGPERGFRPASGPELSSHLRGVTTDLLYVSSRCRLWKRKAGGESCASRAQRVHAPCLPAPHQPGGPEGALLSCGL